MGIRIIADAGKAGSTTMKAYSRVLTCLVAAIMLPGVALAELPAADAMPSVEKPVGSLAFFDRADRNEPVRLAQAGDATYRLGQMEEQIRVLNGRIEELSFQLLEMQESMRKMQEDNEFRFQEIEGGAGGNRTDASETVPSQNEQAAAPVTEPQEDQNTLGSITFDQDGELLTPSEAEQDETQTASLPGDSSEELYRASYGYVLSGDYGLAQTGFQDFIAKYPESNRVADAHFWLGEALYSQGEFHEAAKTLLTAHKQFPQSPKSPEMLLKLGMSLAALDNRDTACATYREVLTRYPQANDAVKAKVAVEQSRMSC